MKSSIFLAIALFAVGIIAEPRCDPKQYDNVVRCYSQFFFNYNLTLGANYTLPDFNDFANNRGRDELGFNNMDMAKVCMIQNSLTNCIGSNSGCIDVSYLPQIFNVSQNDKFAYTEDFFVSNYECKTAYDITMNNFYCLASIGKSGNAAIMKCVNTLNSALANQVDVCVAENAYTQCLMTVYQRYCGNDAATYICNINNIAIQHVIPSCIPTLISCGNYEH
uniref:DUF725 domain-containing protein n=1 Tax=Rhabditophanes sp. KR3021 TaxID=114890 RepID=A0AC35THR6_9BILA